VSDILTVAELAVMLKMNKHQIYEMTKKHTRSGSMRDNPIPAFKINGNLRFRKEDIDAWIEKLVKAGVNPRP
jgi:excisionase family DNA binding protein